jgi:hypothetical protein
LPRRVVANAAPFSNGFVLPMDGHIIKLGHGSLVSLEPKSLGEAVGAIINPLCKKPLRCRTTKLLNDLWALRSAARGPAARRSL